MKVSKRFYYWLAGRLPMRLRAWVMLMLTAKYARKHPEVHFKEIKAIDVIEYYG